jgi:ribulose-bisphosphate carboxylase large chain
MLLFTATYRITTQSEAEAQAIAANVAREQTIECVDEGVPYPFIFEEVLAKVRSVTRHDAQSFDSVIAFNAEVTGYELPQLLNMLYGNCSMLRMVKLVDIDIPAQFRTWLTGPRYGVEGIRQLTRNSHGPMICAAIKPIGLSASDMADIAYRCVMGGADMIKDDHGLANQTWATFQARVAAIADAVARANRVTGQNTLYAPSMLCPIDEFEKRARFAVDAGAQAYLVMPSLTGFDSIRFLASHKLLSKPIMLHPAFMGSYVMHEGSGISHRTLYAQYARLVGADVSIFPSSGGRYGYDRAICVDIAKTCRDPKGIFRPILPGPGGGLRLEHAQTLREMYGNDTMYLFGGAAMQFKDRMTTGLKELKAALALN